MVLKSKTRMFFLVNMGQGGGGSHLGYSSGLKLNCHLPWAGMAHLAGKGPNSARGRWGGDNGGAAYTAKGKHRGEYTVCPPLPQLCSLPTYLLLCLLLLGTATSSP